VVPTFEVEILVPQELTETTRRFLSAAQTSANRILRFSGDDRVIRLTIEATGMNRNEAVRAAAMEVAHILPNSYPEIVEMKETSPSRHRQ
jgi:hypothetical protein